MKILVVLLIFGLVGVYANDHYSREKQIASYCFRQYGENLDACLDVLKTKEKIVEKVTPYKMGCISACYLKEKLLPNNKLVLEDMVKHVVDSLNKVCTNFKERKMYILNTYGDYKNIDNATSKMYGVNHDCIKIAQTIFTQAEMDEFKDIANKCIIEAKEDECKLFECLKPWDSPIGRIIDVP